jgi:hypothetical protein
VIDSRPTTFQFHEERLDILDPDPYPGIQTTLTALAEVDPGPVTVYARESFVTPVCIAEAENVDVVLNARLHVCHSQDRR